MLPRRRLVPVGYHAAIMTEPALHVVLVHPEIPWNTGNIGRTCLATGASLHLVRPLGFSLADKEVRRAGLDYWEAVAPRVWQDWHAFAAAAPALGELFFFSPEGPCTLWEVAYPPRTVLVFGRESEGLPREIRRSHAQQMVRIPMVERGVRALNLSSSVAVALYEVLRQRRHFEKSLGGPSAAAEPPPNP